MGVPEVKGRLRTHFVHPTLLRTDEKSLRSPLDQPSQQLYNSSSIFIQTQTVSHPDLIPPGTSCVNP